MHAWLVHTTKLAVMNKALNDMTCRLEQKSMCGVIQGFTCTATDVATDGTDVAIRRVH